MSSMTVVTGAEGRGDRSIRRRSRFTLTRARAEPLVLWTVAYLVDHCRFMNPDCSTYRSGVLAGRTQALREMSDLISQLALKVEPEHGPEVTMGSLVSNWLEVLAWLNQAETEVADELTLLEASV